MAKKLDKKPGAVPENAPVGMFINAQYLKDLSFENPNPLESFKQSQEKPNIQVNVNTSVKKLPDNAGEDSDSFYDALTGAKEITPRSAMVNHGSQGRFAVRIGKWKLVMEDARKNKRELYDLSSDPKETKNLISAHRDIERDLAGKLTALIAGGRSTPGKPQKNDTPNWRDLVWMAK